MGKMLAIVPARGGSKGLPGKNIKILNGKPLIVWTLEAALNAKKVDDLVISTDDKSIAKVCSEYGVEVPFLRPDELAGDEAKVYDAIVYTVDRYMEMTGDDVDSIIILQPTSPLRKYSHIDDAIHLFEESGQLPVLSVTQNDHPVEWLKKIDDDGFLVNYIEGAEATNRQAYEKTYMPNGMLYIFNYKDYKLSAGNAFSKYIPFVVSKSEATDIDDLTDFQFAEFLMKLNEN